MANPEGFTWQVSSRLRGYKPSLLHTPSTEPEKQTSTNRPPSDMINCYIIFILFVLHSVLFFELICVCIYIYIYIYMHISVLSMHVYIRLQYPYHLHYFHHHSHHNHDE